VGEGKDKDGRDGQRCVEAAASKELKNHISLCENSGIENCRDSSEKYGFPYGFLFRQTNGHNVPPHEKF